MDGVLIIDKPVGFTSHDVVAGVRRILKEKRVGHTGTLDPFATGVLVVLIGRATRLAQFLSGADKEYEGVIRFGYATDTGDSTGAVRHGTKVTSGSNEFAKSWDESTIETGLESLRREIKQLPPMYSAKKVGGRKLYELARKGQEVERTPVSVTVREFEVRRLNGAILTHNSDGTCDMAVRVVCSAGTYVRTLAEDLGERLDVGAHLLSLRRTRAGDFKISEARTLEDLEQYVSSNGDAGNALLPLRSSLSGMASTQLEDDVARRVSHGAMVGSDDRFLDGESVQLCDKAGELIAIGVYDLKRRSIRPRIVLV